jgi:hypothetical protein
MVKEPFNRNFLKSTELGRKLKPRTTLTQAVIYGVCLDDFKMTFRKMISPASGFW